MKSLVWKQQTLIWISILVGMLLEIVPLPHWTLWLRPAWVYMLIIFWVILVPQRVGVGTDFVVGLLMDLLTGTILGLHAFIYVLSAYVLMRFQPQLRNFPLWQQAIMIYLFLFFNVVLQTLVSRLISLQSVSLLFWLSPFIGAVFWIWMVLLLRDWQDRLVEHWL